MPQISVVMGTYNDNQIDAAQAIDSILNQSFANFEFIICDDGSEASYAGWLRSYCRKDPRIRLIRNRKNRGLAAALNQCLVYVQGEYVARMDADDRSAKKRLEKQAAFLKEHREYAFVGCNTRLFGEHGVWGKRKLEEAPCKYSFLDTSPFIHPAVMFRRKALTACGGYCESRLVLRAEDYELFMRLYAAGQRGYNIQEMLFDYREDWQAYRKRKYRYRILECAVRCVGFYRLGILKGNLRYAGKPLIVGILPPSIMEKLHRKRFALRKDVGR